MQEILDRINKRLEALEVVHTRYCGPPGRKGDKGDPGPPGRDDRDSTELETLRAERNNFREELNNFRSQLHDLRATACSELRQLHDEYAARLAEIYRNEADAFCELRDKSCAEIEERLAPSGEGEVRRKHRGRSESD